MSTEIKVYDLRGQRAYIELPEDPERVLEPSKRCNEPEKGCFKGVETKVVKMKDESFALKLIFHKN